MAEAPIHFSLKAIKIDQFATIKDTFKGDDTATLNTGFNFGVSREQSSVIVIFNLSFDSDKQPFIVLNLNCEFSIEPDAFKKFIRKEDGSIKIPKGLLTHFTVLTIGTARGVLYEKLQSTDFKQFLLPTINVSDLLSDDVIFQ